MTVRFGWSTRWSRNRAWFPTERTGIAHSPVAGSSKALLSSPAKISRGLSGVVLFLEDGQRPAPAGELAGDGGVGHGGTFAAGGAGRAAGGSGRGDPLAPGAGG